MKNQCLRILGGLVLLVMVSAIMQAQSPNLSGDFVLNASPSVVEVQPGRTATYSLVVSPRNGFGGTVSLACAPHPAFISCDVSPARVVINPRLPLLEAATIGARSSLSIRRSYRLEIMATSGGTTRTTSIELVVR